MLASVGGILWQIFWFVVAVSILVTIHEFGHFWVARKLGFKVLRFSVGFGPALWRSKPDRHGTEYVVAALPLGGYVKMLDEREAPVPAAERAMSFTQRPPWQRILVLLAGPFINIAFAVLVLWVMFALSGATDVKPIVGQVKSGAPAERAGLRRDDLIVTVNGASVAGRGEVHLGIVEAMSADGRLVLSVLRNGVSRVPIDIQIDDADLRLRLTEPNQLFSGLGFEFFYPPRPALLGKVVSGGPAEQAGFKSGDLIVAIDGEKITTFEDAARLISARPDRATVVELRRGGELRTVTVTPRPEEVAGRIIGRILIEPVPMAWPENLLIKQFFGPFEALSAACSRAWYLTRTQAQLFWRMLTGKVSIKNISGPISIAEFAGDSARAGFSSFVGMLVLISLSLGFLNLLPIPVLDGGQVVYQLAEWLKGGPLSERAQVVGQQLGIVLLVMLMGIALFNDVLRTFQSG